MNIIRKFRLPILVFLISTGINSLRASDSLSIEGYLISKNIKAMKTREGIFYTVGTEGSGVLPRNGDYVKIRYVGKLLGGKKFDESPTNEPFIFQLGYRQVVQGWDIMIPNFKVGTKATLFMPAEFAYGKSGIGTVIPPNTPLIYDIEVEEVLGVKEYNSHMRNLEDSERKTFYQHIEDRFLQDKIKINDYAIAHKLKVQRTESGVSYIVTKEGRGENIKEGNLVTLNFEGYLLDDRMFESNKEKPYTFKLGEEKVIEGLEDGLKFFNKDSEGFIIIPSKLAYSGTTIDDKKIPIPAHSNLIFKIQVIDIQLNIK